MLISRWLDVTLFDHSLKSFLIGGLTLLCVLSGGFLLRYFARGQLARVVAETRSKWDDLLISIVADLRGWLIITAAIYQGATALAIPDSVSRLLHVVFALSCVFQILITSRLIVDFWLHSIAERRLSEDGSVDPAFRSASGIIRHIIMVVLAGVLIVLLLANLGVEVTPLVTGLGIGGVAVALAAQSIMSDIFGSLTILIDRPFLVGDFIVVDDKMGVVENIGVKTTRVRALSGEQLVFSNTKLLGATIQNYQRMRERRVVQTIGVTYETLPDVVERIPHIVREIIAEESLTRFDRAHFSGFGAYSLDFEFVYYVLSPDYNCYMDTQQHINMKIFKRFIRQNIDFAYPTQHVIYRPEHAGDRVFHKERL